MLHCKTAHAPALSDVGIAFPDGTVNGDAQNTKLRLDATYLQQAANGAF